MLGKVLHLFVSFPRVFSASGLMLGFAAIAPVNMLKATLL